MRMSASEGLGRIEIGSAKCAALYASDARPFANAAKTALSR
jgi:hypothetical protein